MNRRVFTFAIALAVCAAPAAASADQSRDAGVVAVLPLVGASTDLEIYSVPVAREVVGTLKKKLSMRVEAISLKGSIPARVTLVIDGRIVGRGGNKVMLTATVRDPARGTRAGTVSTRVRPLTEIDKLASELAGLLTPVVKKAAANAAVRKPERPKTGNVRPVTDLSGGGDKGAADSEPQPRSPRYEDRPVVVVVPPQGTVAGSVSVGPPSYAPMAAAINRLGFATARSARSGIVEPRDAVGDMASLEAEFSLMIQIKDVDFDWGGVLSARGKVRVVLVDSTGKSKYDRTVRTDTLVGSRGDRHAALIGFVAEQAIDIAYPALRRAMR